MRALSAVTDTESDSIVIDCTRVCSASSAPDGNLINNLNGPAGGGGVGGSLHVTRFLGRCIVHLNIILTIPAAFSIFNHNVMRCPSLPGKNQLRDENGNVR